MAFRRRTGGLAVLALVSIALVAQTQHAHADPSSPPAQTCTLEPGSIRTVARVIDGETVVLDDGREVRLIGALAPRASDAGAAQGAWPAERSALQTLSRMVLGQTVKLAYGGRRTDRYGRHLAHLFVMAGANETWVQGELLSAGAARAYGLPGSFACGAEMLAHEALARTARRGLWDTAIYRPKPAHLVALLMSRRSRFEIVEGVVASVSRTKSGTYVNFGTDWKSDFTMRIAKDVLGAHPDLNAMLADIEGKAIAVRGWIERRNGPMIDVRDPAQLELRIAPGADTNRAVSSMQGAPGPAEPANAPAGIAPPAPEEMPKEKRPEVPDGTTPGAVDL